MRTYSNVKQAVIETVPNGANYYRYNFKEVLVAKSASQSEQMQWECEEVVVWSPLSRDKITTAVIDDKWGVNHENKLLNDYYAAMEGILPLDKKQAYLDFLTERKAIKDQIKIDCEEAGIL